MFLERHLAIPLRRATQDGDPVLVMGPRGSGKSSLLQKEFPRHLAVNLDDPSDRSEARRDPGAFLLRLRRPAWIDELQRAPELVEHLQTHPSPVPLVLTSARRLLLPFATLELHGPTLAEIQRRPPLPISLLGRFPAAPRASVPAHTWPTNRRGLELDILELVQVRELDQFEKFLHLAMGSSGTLLHQQQLAREAGVSHRTIVRWLEVLDACFLTIRIAPWPNDLGRRCIRRPKLHFLTGSGCFESEVVSELYRNARHAGDNPRFCYWRDSNGLEIPLLVGQDDGDNWIPVQIAERPSPADEGALKRWMRLANVDGGALICRQLPWKARKDQSISRYEFSQL